MSSEMAEFIVKLANDRELLEKYQEDPAAVLIDAGLNAEDVGILTSRDSHSIRIYLKGPADRQIEVPTKPKKKAAKKKVKK